MDEVFILFIALGFLGGLARSLLGLMKAIGRGERSKPVLFIISLLTSIIIGAMIGAWVNVDYHLAAIAGYAGTDILESIIKTTIPKAVVLQK
jgi:fluoride ion exporter CrcB/FEX